MAINSHCARKQKETSLDHMKMTLTKSTKLLCDNLRLDNILPTLKAMGAVTLDDATKIRKKDTNSEQVEALLEILARSPVSSYEVFMSALEEERPDLYKDVTAIEEEKSDSNAFELERCQQELIDFYNEKMSKVCLLPWFDEETRDMEDIYVTLELENDRKVLDGNENLVNIKKTNGRPATRILVKGTVGSGKSTLLAKLAYTWAQRNPSSPLYKYDLVFILSFREIQKGCSIIDAIFQQILADDTRVSKVALKTYISSNSDVLFLVDGFDEYFAENLDTVHGETDAMLNFKTFRESCVIVSSRPHKHLGKCQVIYIPVSLTGFSSQNVKIYLSKFFRNNSVLVEGLSRKLSVSDTLRSLSHIPIMLMLMCLLWEDSQSLPNKQSDLYAEFTKFLWRKFCHRHNIDSPDDGSFNHFLISLGKVAFDGLMPEGDMCQEKLVFSETDFLNKIKQGYAVGLLTKERLRSKLTVSSSVTFLHKSFQEYCAGYYWASLPDDQFDRVLQRIDTIDQVKNKLEILQYLCGTGDTDHVERTIHHLIQVYLAHITHGDLVYITEVELVGKTIKPVLVMLLESGYPSCNVQLTESLRSLLSAGKELHIPSKSLLWPSFLKSPLATTLNQARSIIFKPLYGIESRKEFDILLETLIHTANVNTARISFEIDIDYPDDPVDSMNKLGKCIARLKNLSTLDLNIDYDITLLLKGISTHREFQLKCMTIDMESKRCDGDILCHLLGNQQQLQNLSLGKIRLFNGTMKSILDAINAPLCDLRIDTMRIGNAIGHIKHIIPQLQSLRLSDTDLNENDILTLGKYLPNAKHLSCLDLSHNHVGKAVHIIGGIIHQLEELNLEQAQLKENDTLTLGEFMNEAKCLSNLNLSHNYVGSTGAIKLCESLKSCSNLKVLDVEGTGLMEDDVSALKEKLSDLIVIGLVLEVEEEEMEEEETMPLSNMMTLMHMMFERGINRLDTTK